MMAHLRSVLGLMVLLVLGLVVSLALGLWENAIEVEPASAYDFSDALPASPNAALISLSILVTATGEAPEALLFEGGSWRTTRTLGHSAVLVCHPDGLLMFDTGLGRNVDAQFEDMPFYIKPFMAYEVTAPVVERLNQEAFCPGRPLVIIASHLHWDHASGIKDFPGVPVWTRDEELVSGLAHGNGSGYLASQIDGPGIEWNTLRFDDTRLANYEQSNDFFGDGSVILVPMAGHTEGSVGMFVDLGTDQRFFFTGDITWALEGFTRPAHKHALMRAVADNDADGVEQEIARVHALMEHDPGLRVIPAHDFDAYGAAALYPDVVSGH